MDPVTYQRPVYYYETDRMDCVHHSNYIRWFEEARIHLMEELRFPYQELEAGGIVSPVLHAEADYRTMARFGETMEIAVQVEGYTGTRIAFSYQVRDKATGVLRWPGPHVPLLPQRGHRQARLPQKSRPRLPPEGAPGPGGNGMRRNP